MKKEVILEGMPARSVPEFIPCFITTDPELQLSRMTATANDRSWTTTFQDDGNNQQPKR